MPGLVEGLLGAKTGERKEIEVTFPPRSSAPQLAGKAAIFEVDVLAVQQRHLPEVGDAFAQRVKSDMTWEELDAKLREGVQHDADEKQKQATHAAFEKALTNALPESFELPETMVEQVTKERFAAMLADMRERGSTDEKLKELVTQENYERYKKISRMQVEKQLKGNLAIKAVGTAQGLVVPRNEVDDEVMTLQAQALQRGEKFKESEVRGKVEMQLEKTMVLDWLESQGTIEIVEPREFDPSEELGATPEELAKMLKSEEAVTAPKAEEAEAAPVAEEAVAAPVAEAAPEPETEPAPESASPAPEPEAAAESEPPAVAPPGGFEWGATF
jgi:trigger factor